MTDDELLATVLRRMLRDENTSILGSDEMVKGPGRLRFGGSVEITRDEHAALVREVRAWQKAKAKARAG